MADFSYFHPCVIKTFCGAECCTAHQNKHFKVPIYCIKSNQTSYTETEFNVKFENFSKCHAIYLN